MLSIAEQTYNTKEANIENLLVTETKDGEKLYRLAVQRMRDMQSLFMEFGNKKDRLKKHHIYEKRLGF